MATHTHLRRLIVLDTGYLAELFQIPQHSKPARFAEVESCFTQAIQDTQSELFLPLPVLFELGNHIAQVTNGHHRKALATQLSNSITDWLSEESPITITPLIGETQSIEELKQALVQIAKSFETQALQQIGLVDTVVSMEAQRLRKKYADSTLKKYRVHIWTYDQNLKAQEPDHEFP